MVYANGATHAGNSERLPEFDPKISCKKKNRPVVTATLEINKGDKTIITALLIKIIKISALVDLVSQVSLENIFKKPNFNDRIHVSDDTTAPQITAQATADAI